MAMPCICGNKTKTGVITLCPTCVLTGMPSAEAVKAAAKDERTHWHTADVERRYLERKVFKQSRTTR